MPGGSVVYRLNSMCVSLTFFRNCMINGLNGLEYFCARLLVLLMQWNEQVFYAELVSQMKYEMQIGVVANFDVYIVSLIMFQFE